MKVEITKNSAIRIKGGKGTVLDLPEKTARILVKRNRARYLEEPNNKVKVTKMNAPNAKQVVETAIEQGVITKNGPHLMYEGKSLGNGKKNVISSLTKAQVKEINNACS